MSAKRPRAWVRMTAWSSKGLQSQTSEDLAAFEVVGPEVHHHLEQLPLRPDGPDQVRLQQVVHRLGAGLGERRTHLGRGRREPGEGPQVALADGVMDRRGSQLAVEPRGWAEPARLGDEGGREAVRRPAQQVQQRVGGEWARRAGGRGGRLRAVDRADQPAGGVRRGAGSVRVRRRPSGGEETAAAGDAFRSAAPPTAAARSPLASVLRVVGLYVSTPPRRQHAHPREELCGIRVVAPEAKVPVHLVGRDSATAHRGHPQPGPCSPSPPAAPPPPHDGSGCLGRHLANPGRPRTRRDPGCFLSPTGC